MTHPIPKVDHAIICGSASWGIRFPEDVAEPGVTVLERDLTFATPYGDVGEWKLIELAGSITADGQPRRVLVVFSHGWPLDEIDHEGTRRVFSVLQQAGVTKVIAMSTMGALNKAILESDFVVCSDIIELTQTKYSLLPGRTRFDCSGKQLFCPILGGVVEATAKEFWPKEARVYGPSAGLVSAHSWGPRLQSPAEATAYRSLGADLVNHSLAPEATLAREIGASLTNVAFVTATYLGYFTPAQRPIIGNDRRLELAPIASRIALHACARFPADADYLGPALRSPQPAIHYDNR